VSKSRRGFTNSEQNEATCECQTHRTLCTASAGARRVPCLCPLNFTAIARGTTNLCRGQWCVASVNVKRDSPEKKNRLRSISPLSLIILIFEYTGRKRGGQSTWYYRARGRSCEPFSHSHKLSVGSCIIFVLITIHHNLLQELTRADVNISIKNRNLISWICVRANVQRQQRCIQYIQKVRTV